MNNELEHLKLSSEMTWKESDCTEIYNGRYSKCLLKGKIVRKYFTYDNQKRFLEEYSKMKTAYEQGILVPKPVAFGYDTELCKWFIESEYLPFVPIEGKLDRPLFDSVCELIGRIQNIHYESDGIWDRQLIDFSGALSYVDKLEAEKKENILDTLRSLKTEKFMHGDFLPKNLGITSGGIATFDFQNSGMGPKQWDLCYFLSDYEPDLISEDIYPLIYDEWIELIMIIIKIRMGRAFRKQEMIEDYKCKLAGWRRFESLKKRENVCE